jgi:uncharacterized protein involved in cysteine biosynthesis
MPAIASALLLALGQMADPRMLRLLAKTVVVALAIFAVLGTLGWFALDWAFSRSGLEDGSFTGAGGLRGAASLLLVLIGGWLLWRIIAMAVIGFYADEVVMAVEARHYPQAAAQARDLPLGEQFTTSLGAAGRALIVNLIALPFAILLIFTGIGAAILFWIVNALLIGRELSDMVWLRHRHAAGAASPISAWERFLLGGVIAGLLLVPLASFLAPLLGAAGAAHLTHRKRNTANA